MPKEICPTTGIKRAQRLQKLPKEICPRIDKSFTNGYASEQHRGRNPNQLAEQPAQRPKGWNFHWMRKWQSELESPPWVLEHMYAQNQLEELKLA